MKNLTTETGPRFFLKDAPKPGPDEVRSSVRFPLNLPVRIAAQGSGPLDARTENISSSGLLLTLEAELPANAQIEFFIQMPAEVMGTEQDVMVHGTGRIVRCYKDSGKTRAAAVIDDYALEAASATDDTVQRTY